MFPAQADTRQTEGIEMLRPNAAATIESNVASSGVIRFPRATMQAGYAFHGATRGVPSSALGAPRVAIDPDNAAHRRAARWHGVSGEVVQVGSDRPFELRFHASSHLLIAYQQAVRRDGDTTIQTLPRSQLRDVSQKLTFVPAGYAFIERHVPAVAMRATFLLIDPSGPLLGAVVGLEQARLKPRLFFENSLLSETVRKLQGLVEMSEARIERCQQCGGSIVAG